MNYGQIELSDKFRKNVTYELKSGNEIFNLHLDTIIDTSNPVSFVRKNSCQRN